MLGFKHINTAVSLLALALYGCGGSSGGSASTPSYELTITNLTTGQPVTPLAVVLHTSAYQGFAAGISASIGLEMLAESGSNTQFLADATADASVMNTASGAGLLLPGTSETITITAADSTGIELTILGMLAATNDGFAGTSGLSLANLVVGATQVVTLPAYDAGTEANTETTATVPALGSGAFTAARDDVNDFVTIHRGVVTADDGLATSDLNQSHRFDNPAIRVKIRRIS